MTGENDYVCSGTTKYTKEKEQSSVDGITWSDTGNYRAGTVVEVNCIECGYVPPISKKVSLYRNGGSDSIDCNGDHYLHQSEMSGFSLSAVTGAVIGDCVRIVGEGSFRGCASLSRVRFSDSVQTVTIRAFENCTSLSVLEDTDSIRGVGFRAFANCTSLTEVRLPGSTLIDDGAFRGCTSLSAVTLGSGTFQIREYAFNGCTSLKSVTIYADEPPALQNVGWFPDNDDLVFYVPSESVGLYKAESGWRNYADRIQAIP